MTEQILPGQVNFWNASDVNTAGSPGNWKGEFIHEHYGVTADEIGFLAGVTGPIQDQIDALMPGGGGGTNALTYKGNGDPSATEFSYLDGVTSPIQTQFNDHQTAIDSVQNQVDDLHTADVAESVGGPYYFTNARARAAISGQAGEIDYNSTTGVISLPDEIAEMTVDELNINTCIVKTRLWIHDGNPAHFPLSIKPNEVFAAARTLNILMGDADRTLNLAIASGKLLGRYSPSTGDIQQISIGSPFSISGTGELTFDEAASFTADEFLANQFVLRDLNGHTLNIHAEDNLGANRNLTIDMAGADGTLTFDADGNVAFVIEDNSIALDKLQPLLPGYLLGRYSAGLGNVQPISLNSQFSISGTGELSVTATIANDSITFAKIQNLNPWVVVGRHQASVGDAEELTFDNTVFSISGAGVIDIKDDAIIYSSSLTANQIALRDQDNHTQTIKTNDFLGASRILTLYCEGGNYSLSVQGDASVSGENTGDQTFSDIVTAGSIGTTQLANSSVTFAKIQNISESVLLGRAGAAGSGAVQQISVGENLMLTAGGELNLYTNVTVETIEVGTYGGLYLIDSDLSNVLRIQPDANLTATRTLTLVTGDASRTLTFTGDASISGTNTGDGPYITGLTEEATIASGDFVAIYDVSASAYRKMTRANFVAGLSSGGGGDLLSTNNLSDVANAATARSNLGLAIGTNVQAYDATLAALASYNTNGILVQTAADTFAGRTITGTSNQVNVSNGNGVSGNPTLSLPQDIHTGASPTFNALNLTTYAQVAGQHRFRMLQSVVRATNASGTINAASNTVTAITFATEAFDTDGMHSIASNTSRLIAPIAGKYILAGGIFWTAQSPGTASLFLCRLSKNGTVIEGSRSYYPPISSFSTNGLGQNVSAIVELAASDYVELEAFQDSSGTLTLDLAKCSFQMVYIGE